VTETNRAPSPARSPEGGPGQTPESPTQRPDSTVLPSQVAPGPETSAEGVPHDSWWYPMFPDESGPNDNPELIAAPRRPQPTVADVAKECQFSGQIQISGPTAAGQRCCLQTRDLTAPQEDRRVPTNGIDHQPTLAG
jgi:hypothetical protein